MRTARKALILVIAGLVVALLGLILSRRPVLLKFTEPGEIVRPSVTIFNPLRNRAPEQIVEQMFNELRRGDVGAAMGPVHCAAKDVIVEKEHSYRLRRWKLVDRIDDPDGVTLYYRTGRGLSGQLDSDVVVCLRRKETGWLVSDYRPMY
jgi:hypothetical protein